MPFWPDSFGGTLGTFCPPVAAELPDWTRPKPTRGFLEPDRLVHASHSPNQELRNQGQEDLSGRSGIPLGGVAAQDADAQPGRQVRQVKADPLRLEGRGDALGVQHGVGTAGVAVSGAGTTVTSKVIALAGQG